ncbi:MAG: (Fe-S)-binding protein [Deltaproteobacteria bacterium]|nr:(Fe-S)-binding protein [Deltaproteobacteria bacterium]
MSLNSHKRDLGNCTYCPKLCRFCCPAAEAEHSETVTPWAKMSLVEMVRAGRLEACDEVGEVFYHCFACLHCRTHCKHENDVPAALLSARNMVLTGGGEPAGVSSFLGKFYDTANPWGIDLSAEYKKLVDKRYFVPEAQAVLFSGCDAIKNGNDNLKKTFELMELIGVDYLAAFDGTDLCCGMPLWQAGDREGFKAHAKKMVGSLSSYRTIVCPCPTCVYALKTLYEEVDLKISAEIVHMTEFLGPIIKNTKPQRRVSGSFVFHDPCYLGRYLEKTNLPREILASVLEEELSELVWEGQDAACCGGGGLVKHVLPEIAEQAAVLRMDQLKSSGANSVATACPGCIEKLGSVADALEVVDLIEILYLAYQK